MIAIVVMMVVCNIVYILIIKLRDVYRESLKQKRIDRLKLISEIEQKYLYFDYRKFFMASLSQQVRYHQEEIVKG